MEEKKVIYFINNKKYIVTRKTKDGNGSTLLERLVDYFSKYNPNELDNNEEEDEFNIHTNE